MTHAQNGIFDLPLTEDEANGMAFWEVQNLLPRGPSSFFQVFLVSGTMLVM